MSAGTAQLHVTTYRKGLLARLGHDLRLTLRDFAIELAAGSVQGRFDLGSMRVLGAVEQGRLNSAVPSAADKAEIERTLSEQILHTVQHPEALLQGQIETEGARVRLRGQLVLLGRGVPIEADVEITAQCVRSAVELVPSRWGIAPYKALGGALRLDDRIGVELELSSAVAGFDRAQLRQSSARWRAPSVT